MPPDRIELDVYMCPCGEPYKVGLPDSHRWCANATHGVGDVYALEYVHRDVHAEVERERDEAVADMRTAREASAALESACERLVKERDEAFGERNLSRGELDDIARLLGLSPDAPGSHQAVLREVRGRADVHQAVERERDEARADLGQISAMLLPDEGPPVQGVHALLDELRIARERADVHEQLLTAARQCITDIDDAWDGSETSPLWGLGGSLREFLEAHGG